MQRCGIFQENFKIITERRRHLKTDLEEEKEKAGQAPQGASNAGAGGVKAQATGAHLTPKGARTAPKRDLGPQVRPASWDLKFRDPQALWPLLRAAAERRLRPTSQTSPSRLPNTCYPGQRRREQPPFRHTCLLASPTDCTLLVRVQQGQGQRALHPHRPLLSGNPATAKLWEHRERTLTPA